MKRLYVPFLLLTLLVAGCEFENPLDGVNFIIAPSIAPTVVTGQVLNSATGQVIENVQFTIQFSGPDAGRIVDESRTQISQLSISGIALFGFGLTGTVPTPANPADIRMQISAPGFLTTSVAIPITGAKVPLRISMVPFNQATSGVATTQATITPAVGMTVQTPSESVAGGIARLQYLPGTTMTDVNNQPLSGALNVSMAYFSSASQEATNAFPGGLMGLRVQQNEGTSGNIGTFISGGFAAIEIHDASGRRARNFSQPVPLTIEVAQGSINPETNQPVRVGDMVPVYSLNTATGDWVFEGRGAATGPNARGNFEVTYNITHLSYYNLDWFWGDYCQFTPNITVNFPTGAFLPDYRFRLSNGTQVLKDGTFTQSLVNFTYAPRNTPVTLEILEGNTLRSTTVIPNLCSESPAITVPGTANPPLTVNVTGSVTCPANDVVLRPSNLWIWYREVDKGWNSVLLTQGRVTFPNMREGREYDFWVWIKNRWEKQRVTLTANAAVPPGVTVTRTTTGYDVTVDFTDTDNVICP